MKRFLIIPVVIFGLILLSTFSCSSPPPKTQVGKSQMDTPAFHVQRGDDALLHNQYESARSAYNRALKLNSTYAPALSGLAAASAYEASRPGVSMQTKKQVLKESQKQINEALDNTSSDDIENLTRAHNFAIQVYLALQLPEDEWYKLAEENFEDAIDLSPNDPAPYFFMAKAEAVHLNYDRASELLQKVIGFAGKYEIEADQELKRIQRIQRALPGSKFGQRIANVDKMTRADVAALFVSELALDKLYKNQTPSTKESYEVPDSQKQMKLDPIQKYPDAVDIVGHPMESVIKEVIGLGIKGLSPDPSHRFYPDKEISRAEFAQLIQDILIKISKDNSLATKYVGENSPFPDVDPNVWYYNAVRVVVNRGLMQVTNKVTGAFEPLKTVSGADALLAIRSLKEMLKAYLR